MSYNHLLLANSFVCMKFNLKAITELLSGEWKGENIFCSIFHIGIFRWVFLIIRDSIEIESVLKL